MTTLHSVDWSGPLIFGLSGAALVASPNACHCVQTVSKMATMKAMTLIFSKVKLVVLAIVVILRSCGNLGSVPNIMGQMLIILNKNLLRN